MSGWGARSPRSKTRWGLYAVTALIVGLFALHHAMSGAAAAAPEFSPQQTVQVASSADLLVEDPLGPCDLGGDDAAGLCLIVLILVGLAILRRHSGVEMIWRSLRAEPPTPAAARPRITTLTPFLQTSVLRC